MSDVFHVDRLAIIGVGLIGGSLALALRENGFRGEIVGSGRSLPNLELARARGIVDTFTTDSAAAVRGAEFVVLGASLGATEGILKAIAANLSADAVLTDVGSVKGSVVTSARAVLGTGFSRFVPGHPIAGTERSGAGAAFATLFQAHKVILTPVDETDAAALAQVRAMWSACGAEVVDMSVEAHDRALAATSHLPHLLAYTLVDQLAGAEDGRQLFDFAAGGFRDFSRIASSNPRMWTEIALANKTQLGDWCEAYLQRFSDLRKALEAGDAAGIEALFERAKAARDACVVPESNEQTDT